MAAPSEHQSLLQLEESVLADIKIYGEMGDTNDDSRSPTKLEGNIQSNLAQIRALTRDLELVVEEVDSDEERQGLVRLLTTHAAEYNRIQRALKEATLLRRQYVAKRAAMERQQLLGTPEGAVRRRQIISEADAINTSIGITESLRRTRQMMSEELDHTGATLAAMEISHSQLSKTKKEYIGQHGLLNRSRGLLRIIEWQNRSETIMLWLGLALFALTAAYVAQKRVLYFVPEPLKPMSILRASVSLVLDKRNASMQRSPVDLSNLPIVPVAAKDHMNVQGLAGQPKPIEAELRGQSSRAPEDAHPSSGLAAQDDAGAPSSLMPTDGQGSSDPSEAREKTRFVLHNDEL